MKNYTEKYLVLGIMFKPMTIPDSENKNIELIHEKEWLINRNEYHLNSLLENIVKMSTSFHEDSERRAKHQIAGRNYFLAGIAFIATLLVGLTSFEYFTKEELIMYLAVDLVIGLISFIWLTTSTIVQRRPLDEVVAAFNQEFLLISGLKPHLVKLSLNYADVNKRKLELFYIFTLCAVGAMEIKRFEILKKASTKTYYSKKMRATLLSGSQMLEYEIKMCKQMYEDNKEELNTEFSDMYQLLSLLEDFNSN